MTVVVGMSGGVDSSVTALLLKQQGYRVIGLYMKNWEEDTPEGVCHAQEDYEDVVRVCDVLEIPYYTVNFSQEYWENVFSQFIKELKMGHTPNPDVLCNREIKFKHLLDKAMELGADYLATGHYCRKGMINGEHCLLKGKDLNKDQSYFLYTIKDYLLQKVLFPIGHLNKPEVRKIAKKHNLPTYEKKDSTGICFIGKRNFKEFVSQYIPFWPGNFENTKGEVVGKHDGVAYYTVGQRRGLGIGGPGDPWFVVGKDVERNVVIIEQGADHPSLYSDQLTATELSWVSFTGLTEVPIKCRAKVRYRQDEQECIIEKIEGDTVFVKFLNPQRAVTPRQSIVFYEGDRCLGGGMIKK